MPWTNTPEPTDAETVATNTDAETVATNTDAELQRLREENASLRFEQEFRQHCHNLNPQAQELVREILVGCTPEQVGPTVQTLQKFVELSTTKAPLKRPAEYTSGEGVPLTDTTSTWNDVITNEYEPRSLLRKK